jgi:hypothetical protein
MHQNSEEKPTEYLRQLYYDSVSLTKTAVDHILTTPGSSDAERAAILGATAEKLLAIKPA